MGFLDFLNYNPDEEEEDQDYEGGNLSQPTRNPYLKNLNRPTTGSVVDYKDQNQMGEYLERSRKPNPSEEMYNQYLQSRPNYEDYKPSFGRKLLAALAGGLGGALKNPQGIKLSQDILHQKYRNALAQHQQEGELLGPRARSADLANQRDLEARKFELTENRRRQDAEAKRQNQLSQQEYTQEKEKASQEYKISKDAETRARQQTLDARADQRLKLSERTANELSGIRKQDQAIKLHEKRTKLQLNKAVFAKTRAHSIVKEKPEYAQYFNDPNDPEDFSLKSDIPESKKDEITFMIRDMEDTLKKSLGLPGAFSPQGYSDIE